MSALYIVTEGDSLTTGNGIGGFSPYPWQLALLYTDNRMVSVSNMATTGNTLADMAAQAASQVDPCFDSRKGRNVACLWGGTNDMYSGVAGDFSGAGAYGRLVTYCQARQSAGFKVAVLNCLPRQNAGVPAGFETQRGIFNASIAANWRTFADALVDVAADSRLQDPTNATYFNPDLVHLTAAGYAIVAALVKAQVDSLL